MSHIIQGDIYGQWVVLSEDLDEPLKVWCVCQCGTKRLVYKNNLRSGKSKSCGCHINVRHGASKTRHYRAWCSARRKGVSDAWKTYEDFERDVPKQTQPGTILARRDYSRPWGPDNWIWTTRKQLLRRLETKNRKLTFEDAQHIRQLRQRGFTLGQIARDKGVHFTMVSKIINRHRWKGPDGE